MHKIDRERLKCLLDYDTGCYPHARANETIRKAAENWLEVSDPGFEVSEAMYHAGEKVTSSAFGGGHEACPETVFLVMKESMIAKAVE